jgi:Asp-tRNA(Asn)/Glu-tRNA(Gln) amidotransferase A subunit family amidase
MNTLDRRQFLGWLSTAGLATVLAPSLARGQQGEVEAITGAAIRNAEALYGLSFTDSERELMMTGVRDHLGNYEALRKLPLGNAVSPALAFSPRLPGKPAETQADGGAVARYPRANRVDASDLAFLSIREQGALLRAGKLRSVDLTRLYLNRLTSFDPQLACVITLTQKRALENAARADDEMRRGVDRGPLHGIPWGAKDLIAARGYRTTWGAKPFENQFVNRDAAVVRKLDAAGAVLVAKLSVGALAWGDVWFGGTTKNPWKLDQGSSGSSAGPASATVAGCVGFALGTETLGSIISPSQRCGASGLRPTFGRVSRDGCMALSWSMDKIGPICRSVDDTALVLDAIRGAEGADACAVDAPFAWDPDADASAIRVGYDAAAFEAESGDRSQDQAALRALRDVGYRLQPVTLPDLPSGDMLIILEAEAAAAFDELTRSNRDDELTRQVEQAWPNVFRTARLIPAVEYIQANRARSLLMTRFDTALEGVDVFVHPTYTSRALVMANLTGHPAVAVPSGFRGDGTPTSISFTGRLYGEEKLCAVAHAFQQRTRFHLRRPPLFS